MENVLADTNIILRSAEITHSDHVVALHAVKALLAKGDQVCIIPQNLIEFWNVATRPLENNGFGWSVVQTDAEVTRLESLLTVLPDTQKIYSEWRRLVLDHSVKGKKVHDARIVAAMKAHQVTKLLTFDIKDFKRYQDISVIEPDSLLSTDVGE